MSVTDEFTHHDSEWKPQRPPYEHKGLKRLDVKDPCYLEQAARLEHLEKISANLGMSDKALEDVQRVRLEVSFVTAGNSTLANFCAQHVHEWYVDATSPKNPYHLDIVFTACAQHGVEPTPTIIRIMAEIAIARMSGDLSGTADKLLKANIRGQLFLIMLNLIHAGDTKKDAASKAAEWANRKFPDQKLYKASSLEKAYEKAFRTLSYDGQTQEQMYFESWDKWKTEEAKIFWQQARQNMPLAGPELTGARHR